MKRITTLTFEFEYAPTPTSEMCVRTAYTRIFEEAKRNLIAKGLLKPMHNDTDSREINTVDNNSHKIYAKTDGSRGVFNNQGSSGKIETLEGDGLSHGEQKRNPGGQSRDGLANQQPILN